MCEVEHLSLLCFNFDDYGSSESEIQNLKLLEYFI